MGNDVSWDCVMVEAPWAHLLEPEGRPTSGIDRAPNSFWRTPEMIGAASQAMAPAYDVDCSVAKMTDERDAALAAIAPMADLRRELGHRIAEVAGVKAERDEAFAMRDETMAALTAMRGERDALRAQMPELEYAARLSRSASGHSVDLARIMLARRDAAEAELSALRTRLAERDASLVKALRQRV